MSETTKGTGLERESRPVPDIKAGLPPHIRSADSLAKRYWGQTLALVPVFVAACFTGHAEILRLLLMCLVSAVAFEFLAVKVFGKKENLRSGETILAAALFALLLPSKCPAEIVILGVFFAVFAARASFGGTGAYPLHPLLLARVFLQACFPQVMAEPVLFSGEGSVWTLAALVLGGILFLKQKQNYWGPPALFMAGCFFCKALPGGGQATPAFFSGVLFISFFLLADPVTLPLSRKGTGFSVLAAALLSSGLALKGFSIRSAAYAILAMNLLAPWLDAGLKPLSRGSNDLPKATYPS
jgi:electron transport complex protein RnfD